MTKGPILIDLDGEAPLSPAKAPPVPDVDPPAGRAMQAAAQVAAPMSGLARWFWRLASLMACTSGTVRFSRQPSRPPAASKLPPWCLHSIRIQPQCCAPRFLFTF
jgi:hypothetical protein